MTAAGKDTRTYAELCKAAVELEREGKWSAAADLYALASKRAKHPPARSAAITKRAAALKNLEADQEETVSPAPIEASPLPGGGDSTSIGVGETDILAGPPAGAVEAAMPTVPTVPLDEQLMGNTTAQANVFSWDQAQPTAEELAASDEEAEDQDDDQDEPKTTTKEKTMTTTATKTSDREAMLAKKERVRMKQNKVEIGMELQHVRRGKTLARCTYAAERCFIFDGKQYSSLSDAGSAAAKKMGMKNPSVNGWIFWGVEKREA